MPRCPVCNSPDIILLESYPEQAHCRLCGAISKPEALIPDAEPTGSALSLQERKYILSLEERIQKLEETVNFLLITTY